MTKEEYKSFWNKIIYFVDDFRREPVEDKLREVNIENQMAAAFYAAVVEVLAKEKKMPVPKWVYHEKYYLKEPAFPGPLKGEYRILMMLETPLAFKTRNIFVGANILSRC